MQSHQQRPRLHRGEGYPQRPIGLHHQARPTVGRTHQPATGLDCPQLGEGLELLLQQPRIGVQVGACQDPAGPSLRRTDQARPIGDLVANGDGQITRRAPQQPRLRPRLHATDRGQSRPAQEGATGDPFPQGYQPVLIDRPLRLQLPRGKAQNTAAQLNLLLAEATAEHLDSPWLRQPLPQGQRPLRQHQQVRALGLRLRLGLPQAPLQGPLLGPTELLPGRNIGLEHQHRQPGSSRISQGAALQLLPAEAMEQRHHQQPGQAAAPEAPPALPPSGQ